MQLSGLFLWHSEVPCLPAAHTSDGLRRFILRD